MQGGSPLLKIASPSPRDVDFSGSQKKCEEGGENVPKMLENSVLDLAVSIFCPIFVVQNERETPLTFCTGNERKKPRARFTTNNGATIFLKIITKV